MNTVKLAIANKQVVAAYALRAVVEAPAGTTIVEKTVYGPTAYNRFIVDGRYVAKNVVEQIWVALANGAEASKARRKSTKAEKIEARAAQDAAFSGTPEQFEAAVKKATNKAMAPIDAAAAGIAADESSLEAQLTASIARNLKVAA